MPDKCLSKGGRSGPGCNFNMPPEVAADLARRPVPKLLESNGLVATFVFLCPNEALKVQGFTAEEIGGAHIYETLICLACSRSHTVNLTTGRVVGADE